MSKGGGYYDGFFGNILATSDKNGKSYDTIYPLNTPDLATKLRWSPYMIGPNAPTIQNEGIYITDKPIFDPIISKYIPAGQEPQLFFTSPPLPDASTQPSETRITFYGGNINTGNPINNYLAPYAQTR
nr:hypothetical protein [Saprospiraceae bacterium]